MKQHIIKACFKLALSDEAYAFAKLRADAEVKTVNEFVIDRLALALDKLMRDSYDRILS